MANKNKRQPKKQNQIAADDDRGSEQPAKRAKATRTTADKGAATTRSSLLSLSLAQKAASSKMPKASKQGTTKAPNQTTKASAETPEPQNRTNNELFGKDKDDCNDNRDSIHRSSRASNHSTNRVGGSAGACNPARPTHDSHYGGPNKENELSRGRPIGTASKGGGSNKKFDDHSVGSEEGDDKRGGTDDESGDDEDDVAKEDNDGRYAQPPVDEQTQRSIVQEDDEEEQDNLVDEEEGEEDEQPVASGSGFPGGENDERSPVQNKKVFQPGEETKLIAQEDKVNRDTVKEYMKETFFKRNKFVYGRNEWDVDNKEIAVAIMDSMNIEPRYRTAFWDSHVKIAKKALNDKRASVGQAMKQAVVGKKFLKAVCGSWYL